MKNPENPVVCSDCGGTNVQVKVWADANTNEFMGDAVLDDSDTWCEDCEEHTGLMNKSEWDEMNEGNEDFNPFE